MAAPYKFRLRQNYDAILKDLDPEKLLSYLFQCGTFELDDMDDVKSEKTRKRKAEALLEKLLRSGTQSMEHFVIALGKKQKHLYELMQQPLPNEGVSLGLSLGGPLPNMSGLYIEPPPSATQKVTAGTPVEQGETSKLPSQPPSNLPPRLGNTEKGAAFCQSVDDHDYFVVPTDLSKVPPRDHPGSDGNYKMSAKPRGIALIINNEVFGPDSELTKKELETRHGSNKDVEKLEQLFQALDFKVKTSRNITKDEMLKVLDETASPQVTDHTDYDCFVLVLMSHGEDGKLYGTDGGTVDIDTVRDMFNNSNCRSLTGKPKLFFIQACRGKLRDSGVVADAPGAVRRQPSTSDDPSVDRNESTDRGYRFTLSRSIPGHADTLLAYSTVGGFASFRNTTEGSRFVRCLVEVFQEFAGYEDLLSMLTKVNERVSKMGELGSKQISQPEHTLRKKLFFWPGLNTQILDT